MNVNFNESMYVNGASAVQPMTQLPPSPPPSSDDNDGLRIGNGDRDSYIPSMASFDAVMPTGTYGANGMMVGDMPPVQQMSAIDLTDTESSLMDALSQEFRANQDSILMTMNSLGLSLEDLSDESNLTTLANAMNEGAANLGVPQV